MTGTLTIALFLVLRHVRWTKPYEERRLTVGSVLRNSCADSDGRRDGTQYSVLGLKSALGGVTVYVRGSHSSRRMRRRNDVDSKLTCESIGPEL